MAGSIHKKGRSPVGARIRGISRYLPEGTVSNDDLSELFPEWSVEKIASKTGIHQRHVASESEFSSDLATQACFLLLSEMSIDVEIFDFLIVVTQTPDFILPGISNLVHNAIGMRSDTGTIDLNQGCSGYTYGLAFAKSIIEAGVAANVLLVTTDTYTKLLDPGDKSVRTLFGDGATATWVDGSGTAESLSGIVFGTDGSGAGSLIVPLGGLRPGYTSFPKSDPALRGLGGSRYSLYMDGPEIFNFTLRVVSKTVDSILSKAGLSKSDIDFFVLHQANAFVLSSLREKLGVEAETVPILMGMWGNTVSSTIPMALCELKSQGKIGQGQRAILLGFGVGLSWGGLTALLDW
jgi:3-oxoacyl-[acyl-carrier-protein] synthase III